MAVGSSHREAFCIPAGENLLAPSRGYLPSCSPTTLHYSEPLWGFFGFLEKAVRGSSHPLQPPKPDVPWPLPCSRLPRWQIWPWYITDVPAGLQAAEPPWGNTSSTGRLCYVPASSPANEGKRQPAGGCRREGAAKHRAGSRASPRSPHKHGLGLSLSMRQYEASSSQKSFCRFNMQSGKTRVVIRITCVHVSHESSVSVQTAAFSVSG